MITYLQNKFALSLQGAKDLFKGIVYSLLLDLSFMLPVGLAVLALSQYVEPIIGGEASQHGWVFYLTLGIGILLLMGWISRQQYMAVYIGTFSESANRRIGLAEQLRLLPISYFSKKNLSDLTGTIMGDCAELEKAFSHSIPQLIGSSISLVIITIPLLIINWKLTLALLWVVPVALLVMKVTKKANERYSYKHYQNKRNIAEKLQEGFEGIHEIKANNGEKRYMDSFDAILSASERAQIKSQLVMGTIVNSAQMILKLGLVSLVFFGIKLMMAGEVTLMVYLMFLIVASRIFNPLTSMFDFIAHLSSIKAQVERMKEVYEQPKPTGTADYQLDGTDIVFDCVDFSYEADKQVLHNTSFTAKQGEITALVGASGSGKSTAVKLLARFWEVNRGKITVGGVDIKTIDPEALLKHFSIVFQEVTLFNSSILENIRIGKPTATIDEVKAAAELAGCSDFINRMEQGYDTEIGENGAVLSGGERQRISIARALLKDAPIILLDEASASLDVENESKIQRGISALIRNKTVLVIAHRMRTIANANRIVVLEGGTVVEDGRFEELMQRRGVFYQMNRPN